MLAACYPATSSRYSYGREGVYLLFQPEVSFLDKGITSDSDPNSVRHTTRKRFDEADQSYECRDSSQFTMVNWIVRPESDKEPPIRWWEM